VDGKIRAVGTISAADIPADAQVIDRPGIHVTAGLIDCHNHSMVFGGVNEATLPSTAMVRVGDVVNSEAEMIHQQLAGGLTVANLLHGSANPIGGQNCVIKLRDGAAPEGLKFRGRPAASNSPSAKT
jgi:imidazolonepropionase-like amidohydrolase